MTIRRTILLAATAMSLPNVAHADPLAYVRASSQHLAETAPELYHPLNLLDDDSATMWCEGSPGVGEGAEVRFYFKKEQRVDRVVIGPAAASGRIVRAVTISDGTNSPVRIELAGEYADQQLGQPLKGTTLVVTIAQIGGPNETTKLPDDVACLSDVLFYKGRTPVISKATVKLGYDAMRDRLLGHWSGEPMGAPEKFLTFSVDGTWDWSFVPLFEGKSEKMSGEYRFRGERLLMRRGETGRWADMRFSYRRVRVEPNEPGAPLGDYDVISLDAVLGEKLAGEYNNAKF